MPADKNEFPIKLPVVVSSYYYIIIILFFLFSLTIHFLATAFGIDTFSALSNTYFVMAVVMGTISIFKATMKLDEKYKETKDGGTLIAMLFLSFAGILLLFAGMIYAILLFRWIEGYSFVFIAIGIIMAIYFSVPESAMPFILYALTLNNVVLSFNVLNQPDLLMILVFLSFMIFDMGYARVIFLKLRDAVSSEDSEQILKASTTITRWMSFTAMAYTITFALFYIIYSFVISKTMDGMIDASMVAILSFTLMVIIFSIRYVVSNFQSKRGWVMYGSQNR